LKSLIKTKDQASSSRIRYRCGCGVLLRDRAGLRLCTRLEAHSKIAARAHAQLPEYRLELACDGMLAASAAVVRCRHWSILPLRVRRCRAQPRSVARWFAPRSADTRRSIGVPLPAQLPQACV
jgi:hypothetical protein